jgi:hypothetical protein
MFVVEIDCNKITDGQSLHDVFAAAFGFPAFYGRNMDAWIDCLTCLDDPGAGMTSIHVGPGEILVLALHNATGFKTRCPELFAAVVECAAFVNWRRIEKGESAVLALSFYASGA